MQQISTAENSELKPKAFVRWGMIILSNKNTSIPTAVYDYKLLLENSTCWKQVQCWKEVTSQKAPKPYEKLLIFFQLNKQPPTLLTNTSLSGLDAKKQSKTKAFKIPKPQLFYLHHHSHKQGTTPRKAMELLHLHFPIWESKLWHFPFPH